MIIQLMRTADMDYVRGAFTHPDIWDFICDDASGDKSKYEPLIHESIRYLIPIVDGAPAGCIILQKLNGVLVELHSALFVEFRGKAAGEIYRALLDYIAKELPEVSRLRTWVPSCNRAAFVAAKRERMELVGTEPLSFMKNGQLYDLHLFGVNISCQQQGR